MFSSQVPPTSAFFSSTTNGMPACESRCAATMPDIPAPMTATAWAIGIDLILVPARSAWIGIRKVGLLFEERQVIVVYRRAGGERRQLAKRLIVQAVSQRPRVAIAQPAQGVEGEVANPILLLLGQTALGHRGLLSSDRSVRRLRAGPDRPSPPRARAAVGRSAVARTPRSSSSVAVMGSTDRSLEGGLDRAVDMGAEIPLPDLMAVSLHA